MTFLQKSKILIDRDSFIYHSFERMRKAKVGAKLLLLGPKQRSGRKPILRYTSIVL